MNLPSSVRKLIQALSELPSIGPRQATRLVFYLIGRGEAHIHELARNLDQLKKIKVCERCFFIHENAGSLCNICSDPHRNQSVIMLVEKETDLTSLENTGRFKGRYLILGPIPKTGALEDWQKLRLQSLKSVIAKEGQAEEIILGLNPTSVGDFHASLLVKELAGSAKKISRLGRGLPTGGEIEFADDETLGASLERRS
ncbi:MAG: Recombination protein RecR [Parcubacteria group bacterium GW2011_GWA1_59_11]|nr:MAG: Recombination protein RecR [Parcubacteria group bacterium GW2011_GWA1_59_11]